MQGSPLSALPALLLVLAPAVDARGQDTVELEAAWGPIASSTYHFTERHPAVARAFGAGPTTPRAAHPLDALRALLPPADVLAGTAADAVWVLDVDLVLPFLAQLHPGVTSRLRHAHPPGDLAEILRKQGDLAIWTPPAVEGGRASLLRATEDELAVLLRVHVEFELIPDQLFFLPAQFEGHLVWDRIDDRPRSFHLALPPRNTNFDINYEHTADIGYLPLMQVATAGAAPAGPEAEPARQRMRESFYPACRIQWRSLADAFARAKENGRRLHVMQLFGTFDDESC